MAEDNNPGGEEATPVKHCSLWARHPKRSLDGWKDACWNVSSCKYRTL
jgi:hypothetical protein